MRWSAVESWDLHTRTANEKASPASLSSFRLCRPTVLIKSYENFTGVAFRIIRTSNQTNKNNIQSSLENASRILFRIALNACFVFTFYFIVFIHFFFPANVAKSCHVDHFAIFCLYRTDRISSSVGDIEISQYSNMWNIQVTLDKRV